MATLIWTLFLAWIPLLCFCNCISHAYENTFLSHEELRNYIGKEDKIVGYHIAQPKEIGASSRSRRSTTDTEQTTQHHHENARQFEFDAFDTTYHVVVDSAKGLVKEGLEAEFVGSDGRVTHSEPVHTECLYQGELVFPAEFNGGNSNAALSLCSGLTGVISTPEYDLVIRPLHEHHAQRFRREAEMRVPEDDTSFARNAARSLSSDPLHIVIKRDAQYPDDRDTESGNDTLVAGDDDDMQEEHFCGLDSRYFDTLFNHTTPMQSQARAGYTGRKKRDTERKRRETDGAKAMEMLVVADNQMRLFYGPDVANYTLILMNIAAGRFRHESLGRGLYFHIVKLMVMTSDSITTEDGATLNSVPDGELTLSSFCSYQYHTNQLDDDHPDHYDNAVFITRHDIELKQNKYLLGIANLRGACSATHQCSVNEDNGPSSGLIIAHEIGHTVGMLHDTDTGCSGGTNIMSSSRIGGTGSYLWSECSREQLDAFLRYPTITCLDDIPEVLVGYEGEKLPGEIYDADEQCLQYSDYFSGACTDTALPIYGVQDRCPKMFCRFPNGLCSRTGVATADGTTCGEHKWCIEGTCVDRPNTPINGGWSPWDATWGPCSRTCGGGVELRYRYCNNPEPHNGGEPCQGESTVANLCNVQECKTTQREFRDEQCMSSGLEQYDNHDLTWTSTTQNLSGDQLCELWCQADIESETGETLRVLDQRDGAYTDGTRCSLEYGEMRVCVQGTCREFGCDGYQYSGVDFDNCRVCGGNGSTCRRVDGSIQLNLSEQQFITFLTVQQNVTSLSVINTNTTTFMDVMINGQLAIGGSSQTRSPRWEYRVGNTTVHYHVASGQEIITIAGPTLDDIEIQAFADTSGRIASGDIRYVYYVSESILVPTPTPTPVTHIWAKSGGECSVTCGVGTRMEVVRCVDVISVQFVDDIYCDAASRHVPIVESCQEDNCPPRWFLADLNTTCSATCGEGVRTRVVVCLLFAVDGVRVVDDSFCDDSEKPSAVEPCTDLPRCPGTWVLSSWSECKPCANRTRLALCRTGSDFLTVLDDDECPQPKPHTSEPCACVTSTVKPGEASSHSTEDDVTMATTQPGGVSEPPVVRSDDNFLTHDQGTIERIGSTDGALSSIVIVAPLGHVVLVNFKLVYVDCSSGDSFRVKDEENVYSACSSFTNFNWTSTSNILQFDLTTVADDRGYSLSYRFIPISVSTSDCDQVFLEESGTLTSPNYPSRYPADQRCVYHIVAPPNVRINLYFDVFNLHVEDALLCSTTRDHILIKDLDQRFYSSIYCGQHVPFGYFSSGNRLRISFFSDSDYSSFGFSATYAFVN
ncbi:A disintegrin and metalloproteinase with thrombospondin motifs 13 [Strongylocentrotus purpuratus]|uniref:Uncharacterized protein n=1 Tax=Strongylocentrotus purpuratus TaxID=7668 RepID=A0A7M7HJI7_STRPU|nr:A disintegrin and metalloproteinase with thrombospondin motifs 13 [Strongylocentrotus purpuratus]